MPLVKAGQIVEDRYVRVLDDAPIPEGVPVIVTGQRFISDAADLVARDAPVGVLWPNDRRVAELAPWLKDLSLIALVFPKFRDGRAYSQARLLRERHDYRGELRATGDVLRDQFQFLVRAGFDPLRSKNRRMRRYLRNPRRVFPCSISRVPTAACRRCAGDCKVAVPLKARETA